MHCKRNRFCYALATKFGASKSAYKQEQWASLAGTIQKVEWTQIHTSWKMELTEEKVPEFSENCTPIASNLHSVLDALPKNGGHEYLLDVLWFTDTLPSVKKLPSSLYGALKRCVDWHGGAIYVVYNKLDAKANYTSYVQDLRMELVSVADASSLHEFIDANLFWRGSLAFFDDDSMSFQHMGAFELSALDDTDDTDWRNSLVSQRLKVLSKCSIVTIPQYYLTKSRFILRTSLLSSDDDMSEDFLSSHDMFGPDFCIIAKLERFESTASKGAFLQAKKSSLRTTEGWKKAILDGSHSLEIDHELAGKSLKSTYLMICDAPNLANRYEERNCLEKMCIVLDPNVALAGFVKKSDVIHDILFTKDSTKEFIEEINVFEETLFEDLEDLKAYIDLALPKVMEEMKRRNPDKTFVDQDLEKDALAVLNKVLKLKPQTMALPNHKECQSCRTLPFSEAMPKLESDEKRFLAFVEHCKQKNEERKKALQNNEDKMMMVPSGDFVILEAKEMLEHFTAEGLPKAHGTSIIHPSKSKPIINPDLSELDLRQKISWPDCLVTQYHDIYYNKSDSSEKNDLAYAKTQQIYVGSRETASTCHGLNACQTVVQTKKEDDKTTPSQANVGQTKKEEPKKLERVLRRTPRKTSKSAKDPQDIFKQKLRMAVYTALQDLKITEKDALFRPCFKKLFDMCNVFAKDMPKNTSSTKQWLSMVAKQNAGFVVNFEKSMHVKK